MKKFLVCVAVALTAGIFASCDDQVGCWEITTDVTIGENTTRTVIYYYGTREEAKAAAQEGDATIGDNIKVETKYKKVNKSESDCALANLPG